MCGQAGVIFGTKQRTRDEIDHLTGLFTNVLELSEERGPQATGVAWVNQDGEHKISKLAVPASEFVRDKAYTEVIDDIDNTTNLLMGHTRWPTRGDISNIANSQPKRTGAIVATHNGTVINANWLFHRFRLPRHAEVDSEVIFRFADECVGHDGRINVHSLAQRLALCKGSLASVMVAKTDPSRIIMIKGARPLEMMYSERYGVVLYASNMDYIKYAVGGEFGWIEARIPRDALVVINTSSMTITEIVPVRWQRSTTLC